MTIPRTFELKRLLDATGPLTLREAALRTGYTPRQTSRALEQLEKTSLVVSRGNARRRVYFVNRDACA